MVILSLWYFRSVSELRLTIEEPEKKSVKSVTPEVFSLTLVQVFGEDVAFVATWSSVVRIACLLHKLPLLLLLFLNSWYVWIWVKSHLFLRSSTASLSRSAWHFRRYFLVVVLVGVWRRSNDHLPLLPLAYGTYRRAVEKLLYDKIAMIAHWVKKY